MLRLIIRPSAELDVTSAEHWYRNQRDDLGDQFLSAIDAIVEAISAVPERFPIVYRGFRRALLQRFPYAVFFSLQPNVVFLVACIHQRRNPGFVRRRLRREGGAI